MEKQKDYKNVIILGLSNLLGIGHLPFAQGTFASLAAVGIFLSVKNEILFLLLTAISVVIAFMVSGKAEKIYNKKDPHEVVIDDFAGQLIALLLIPKEWIYVFLSFILFRLFDIFKLPPADALEKKKGSLGIVGDDLVAGLYANVIVQLVRLVLKTSS